LQDLAERAGEEICYQLEDQPFKTYVASIEDGKITIRAGQNAGVRKGSVFSVYGGGDIVNGKDGHRFIVPGEKTGEIKITNVYENRSEGVVISGQVTDPASVIKTSN